MSKKNSEIDYKIMEALAEIRKNLVYQKAKGRRLDKEQHRKIIVETNKEIQESLSRVEKVFSKKTAALLLASSLAISGVAGGAIGYNLGAERNNEDAELEEVLKVDKDSPEAVKAEYIRLQVEEVKQKIESFETREDVMNFMAELYAKDYEAVTGKELDSEKLDFVLLSDRAIVKDGKTVKADVFCVQEGPFKTLETAEGNAHKLNAISGETILSQNEGYSIYSSLWGFGEDLRAKNNRGNDIEFIKRYEEKIKDEWGIEDKITYGTNYSNLQDIKDIDEGR